MVMGGGGGVHTGLSVEVPPTPVRGALHRHRKGSSSKGKSPSQRPFSASLDLGVIQTGYLQKLSTRMLQGKKRRFLVLTTTNLRWYKRENPDELFGEEIGSLALKDVAQVESVDNTTFEVLSSADGRKRLFRAEDSMERDMWVEAIRDAAKIKGGLGQPELPVAQVEAISIDEELPVIDMVTVKRAAIAGSEFVVAHDLGYGKALALRAVDLTDSVILRLSSGTYAAVEVKALVADRSKGTATRVTTVSGDGDLFIKPLPPAPGLSDMGDNSRWYCNEEVFKATGFVLVALYGWNLLSLCLVLYAGWCLYSVHAKSLTTVQSLELVVDSFQPVVDVAAVERARKAAEIPYKFLEGCLGDVVEARRRWDITRAWREKFEVDLVLERPHPNFDVIKKYWPHFFLPFTRNKEPVYCERTGGFNFPALMAAGVTVEDLLHHCVYETEYLYKHLYPDINKSKLVSIFDLSGANMGDLKGEARVFLKRVLAFLQLHYPERSRAIIIANAPGWFSLVWKIIRPLLNENTARKIRIAASGDETYRTLLEFMEPENIPVEFGGKLKYGDQPDSCRFNTPQELAFRKYVMDMNARLPPDQKPPRVC